MTHEYNARVARVIDGDTIALDVDLGFDVWLRDINFRLLGINAREKAQVGGQEARRHLSGLLPAQTEVTIRSVKPDKFGGRYDAQVTLPGGDDLSTYLLREGWAAPWNGIGIRPVPAWPRS